MVAAAWFPRTAYLGTDMFPSANKSVSLTDSTSFDISFSGEETQAAYSIGLLAKASARLTSDRVWSPRAAPRAWFCVLAMP
jgi:hypothetical protein